MLTSIIKLRKNLAAIPTYELNSDLDMISAELHAAEKELYNLLNDLHDLPEVSEVPVNKINDILRKLSV